MGAITPEVKAVRNYIEKAMTFAEYVSLIDNLLATGKTTGPVQSESMFNYAKLNRQRMTRLEKTIVVEPAVANDVAGLKVDWFWLVIAEGWCGDAAQNIPVIEKIAALNPGIKTRYILRDENPKLMDRYLTNGARSIPMLIAIDSQSFAVLGTWGSRPKEGQKYFLELKAQGMPKPAINEKMQRWYNEDKGNSLERELAGLVKTWSAKAVANKAAVAQK